MSMMTSQPSNAYSAHVRLQAHVDGRTHRLTHVGPNEIILSEPAALNAGTILVDVVVDDQCQTYQAELAFPLPPDTVRVPVVFAHHKTGTPAHKK